MRARARVIAMGHPVARHARVLCRVSTWCRHDGAALLDGCSARSPQPVPLVHRGATRPHPRGRITSRGREPRGLCKGNISCSCRAPEHRTPRLTKSIHYQMDQSHYQMDGDEVAGSDAEEQLLFLRMLDLFDRVVRQANPRLPNMLSFSAKRLRAHAGVVQSSGPTRHRISASGLVDAARAVSGGLFASAAGPKQHASQTIRPDAGGRVISEPPLHEFLSRCVKRTVS